jgi:hypothetical protein
MDIAASTVVNKPKYSTEDPKAANGKQKTIIFEEE